MIPIKKARVPKDFNKNIRARGRMAIAEMVGEPSGRRAGRPLAKIADHREDIPADKFPPYWTEAIDDLMEAYRQICAYSCFRIHPVTGAASVDHFAPKSLKWDKVYEWSNYRLCCSRLNARKRDFGDVLDPFLLKPDWFHIEFFGYQAIPDPRLPIARRTKVLNTIERLKLNDAWILRARREDAERYVDGDISLGVLIVESPFVASELRRQGKLRERDVWPESTAV